MPPHPIPPNLPISLSCHWISHLCSCRHVATSSGPSRKFFFPPSEYIHHLHQCCLCIHRDAKQGGAKTPKSIRKQIAFTVFVMLCLSGVFFAFFFLFIFHRAKISHTKKSFLYSVWFSGLWKQLVCCFDTLGPFSGFPLSSPVSCVNNSVVSLAKHVCLISMGVRIRRGVTHFLEALSCWHCEMKALS